MHHASRILRREWFRGAAAGALAPWLAGGLLHDELPAQAGNQAQRGTLLDRWLELVTRHYPQRPFDAAALAQIRTDLELQSANSRALSAFPLTNGDGPGFVFRAFRSD